MSGATQENFPYNIHFFIPYQNFILVLKKIGCFYEVCILSIIKEIEEVFSIS